VDLRGQLPIRPGRVYYTRPLSGISGVTVHYTAGSSWATVRDIAAYQVGPDAHEAFPAIAYTLVVTRDGTVHLCHDLETRCWHNEARPGGVARNATHVGICFTGAGWPTVDQILGLARAIVWTERSLGRRLEIEGHQDSSDTRCPGDDWPAWREHLATALVVWRGAS